MKKGLGRGLDSIFADNYIEVAAANEGIQTLRISQIEPKADWQCSASGFDERPKCRPLRHVYRHCGAGCQERAAGAAGGTPGDGLQLPVYLAAGP